MNAVLEAREPSARHLAAIEEPLIQQFDLIASALNGVARLRELILSLAVQGKLVPQDPNDEPASLLLEHIRGEKALLVKEGKIRKEKPRAEICEEKKPFRLPNGWTEMSFASIGSFSGGKTPSTHRPEYWEGTIPWVTSKDMKSLWISDTQDHVTQQALADGLALIPSGAVLVVVRSGILRRTVPVAITSVPCTVNQDLKALQLVNPCMAQYVQLMIRGFERFILENLTKVGTTVESIRFEDFENYPFPIPPLAEQTRITTRAEELMALCDALEAKGKLEAEQHAQLVSSLFDSLTNSESAHALAENWQRIATHFDLLLDRPAAVDALEQTILQLAVRGLLVPQSPSDEPASALLQKIRSEKDRLIAAGKIKRDKPLSPIADKEKPFKFPRGWDSFSFPELCLIGGGATPSKAKPMYWEGDLPWVSPKDMKVDFISDAKDHVSKLALIETPLPLVPKGSLLIVVRGMILAHSFPVGVTQVEVTINQDMKSLTPLVPELTPYLALACKGFKQNILELVERSSHGTCKLESDKLFAFRFGMPPLPEQARIVARVTELHALCAQLRECLAATEQNQSRLAEASIEKAVT